MAIAAVGQICSTASVKNNLDQCVTLVAKAAAGGAKLLFLPEASDYIAPSAQASLELAVPQTTSPFVSGLRAAAKAHSVAVHVGIHHVSESPAHSQTGASSASITRKVLNRALFISSDGTINNSATYDKLHVFDYGSLRESATVQPGTSLTPPFDSPVGRIGSLICFDLRFPETAIALAQPSESSPWAKRPAQILTYPSAFTIRTGQAHWETLLRARAIETQSWVVASAQVGRHTDKRASYGRSLVVDPWGKVCVRLGGVKDVDAASAATGSTHNTLEGEPEKDAFGAIGFVDLDMNEVERIRQEMPLQRRTLN